jgi:hypothetical protein
MFTEHLEELFSELAPPDFGKSDRRAVAKAVTEVYFAFKKAVDRRCAAGKGQNSELEELLPTFYASLLARELAELGSGKKVIPPSPDEQFF